MRAFPVPGRGPWLAAALAAFLLLAGGSAAARVVLDLDARPQPVALADWGDAWLDRSGSAAPETVATADVPWQPTGEGTIYKVRHGEVLWIRFTVPPAADTERWYVQIPYPNVNRVTLYARDDAGRWIGQSAGDAIPVAQWPVPHRYPLMPLSVSAAVPRFHLLRVESGHNFSAPLQFIGESHLHLNEHRVSLVLGMYFGLTALTFALALAGALWLRDKAYSLFALSIALLGLTQASLTGVAGLHLWPRWPWWNDIAPQILPVLGTAALLWFCAAVVSLGERSRRLNALQLGVAALALPVAMATLYLDQASWFLVVAPYAILACTLTTAMMAWAAWRGDRYAPWLLVGWLPVMAGAAFPLARTAGLLPIGFWTTHGMQVGIAIELPVLLVLLAIRSQYRREHIRRIQGLERIDPATGLINAQVFQERLVRLIARSRRLKLRSAILLVDVVNTEQIRREFGGESMRELILRVAGRLLAGAREIDSVARLSHHRFGVLLEGPLKADEVAEAGPRIVARCLMPFKKRPLEWTARVRVAQGLIPMDGDDPAQLIGQLEMLLAAAPEDSRRAVYMLSRPAGLNSRNAFLTSAS